MSNEDKSIQNAGPDQPLAGRIALVAGATRGASRAQAVELGRAGATVYVTGRTTRTRASEVGRTSETIEETAEFVTAAGGTGIAVPTDHLDEDQVRALARRIDREQGRLDVLGEETGPGSPPLRATASQPSRRMRSFTARHHGLPGRSPDVGRSTPRRTCQPMNDIAARRNGRCRGAVPNGPA
ncbi:SDR family NAD(P)-dependent oxidoreductase [Streptomyces sp. WM6373]|uniref:SDR family NAD(P)-dependent oxidoreductase n=1 Tax=Streptomyces sp. WM6373 TaxID=1415556 RepID=UPI000AA8CD8A|nr:SDR family NAD(P)-dependent oxidoreductase [Streptomyces sp. WM6373]